MPKWFQKRKSGGGGTQKSELDVVLFCSGMLAETGREFIAHVAQRRRL